MEGRFFQIIYEQFESEDGLIIENGDIIFANLNTQGLNLCKFELEKNKIDYFDEAEKYKKTLMKTPINGARLSSPFGRAPYIRVHKMHTGTDFAAPTGTPIVASGDGIVTRHNGVVVEETVLGKHNSVYQTVYAHVKIW